MSDDSAGVGNNEKTVELETKESDVATKEKRESEAATEESKEPEDEAKEEKQELIKGVTAVQAKQIVEEMKNEVYMLGINNHESLEEILLPVGNDLVSEFMWKKMANNLAKSMKNQISSTKFVWNKSIHRFPDIFPYDFNAMPMHIGSWMGDAFGLMQWPMPGTDYDKILQQVVTNNNVGMIVALGKQEKNQRVEMASYWETLGKHFESKVEKNCIIRTITGIPPNNHICVLYQFENWPDRGEPQEHLNVFDYLFPKIQEQEKAGKKVIVHCRAGVGRSGSLRLMYYAWKKELSSDDLSKEFNTQRALRMWSIQTRIQFNFVQNYIKQQEGDVKSKKKSFENFGGDAFNEKNFAKAAYWFFMYQSYGLGKHYTNYQTAIQNLSEDYRGFDNFLRNKLQQDELKVNTTWEEVEELWKNNNEADPYSSSGW